MNLELSSRERRLICGCAALALLAILGPAVAPPPFGDFVDVRAWGGIANAGDVLSNLFFLAAGLAGLVAVARVPSGTIAKAERAMAVVFFSGLVATSACSAWFHLAPDDARLALDRGGMALAFAGMLGLVTAGRVSARAGFVLACVVLVAAPWTIHAASSGDVLPWAVVQFGGMVILGALAFARPRAGALAVRWFAVIAIYAVAKVCESFDGAIFELTAQAISGHSLKHVVASFAAVPVIAALSGLEVRGQNGRTRIAASITRRNAQ